MAEYSVQLFRHVATRDHDTAHPRPGIPLTLSYTMLEDAHHIAELAGKAYNNQKHLPWRMSDYAEELGKAYTGRNGAKEKVLDALFPAGEDLSSNGNHLDRPCIIIDAEDNILTWYLPDIISRDAHTEWQESNDILDRVISEESRNKHLLHNPVYGFPTWKDGSWRRDGKYFTPGERLSPGVADIASCWFQAGHSGGNSMPEVSNALKTPALSSASWLRANSRLQAIVASILAVTHPEQYKAGLDMLKALEADPTHLREPAAITNVLHCWYTPYSGVSLICNRETPRHKDSQGRHEWYDVLATMGTHPTIGFHLPGLQTTFAYSPRTVVALCGRILSHSVDHSDRGDRACSAWFMREDVRAYLDVAPGGSSTLDRVLGICQPRCMPDGGK